MMLGPIKFLCICYVLYQASRIVKMSFTVHPHKHKTEIAKSHALTPVSFNLYFKQNPCATYTFPICMLFSTSANLKLFANVS